MITTRDAILGAAIWAQLRQGVLRRLRVLLRGLSTAAVEDVAQEVLLGLHRSIAVNGPPQGIDALVTVICRRKAASALRHLLVERRHLIHDEQAIHHAPSGCPDPDAELIRLDQARVARRVLECIREQGVQSEAVARGRLQGLAYQDIAEPLGITADAARQTWHRSVVQVRRMLPPGDFDGPAGSRDRLRPSRRRAIRSSHHASDER